MALFYLSQWKSKAAADDFVKMYSDELAKKYNHVARDTSAEASPDEQVYQTSEGPVLFVTTGNDVFVSESYDLNTARKLSALMLAAQLPTGPGSLNASLTAQHAAPGSDLARSLSGNIVRFMAGCGMMKAALPHHLY